jgi:hypothetical protein
MAQFVIKRARLRYLLAQKLQNFALAISTIKIRDQKRIFGLTSIVRPFKIAWPLQLLRPGTLDR